MKLQAIVLGVALVTGSTGMNPTVDALTSEEFSAELAVFQFEIPLASFTTCRACVYCYGSDSIHMMVNEAGAYDIAPGSAHYDDCWGTGYCSLNHLFSTNCGGIMGDPLARAELWETATSGSAEAVLAALAQHPEAISLNMERASLQLFSCTGDILANIPLSPERLAALE